MGEFDIDDSIDTSFSDDNSLDSFESSGDAFDAMDTVEVPPFEAPSLDNIESGGIEDHSFDDTEILSNGVDDIMDDVEPEVLEFDDQVEEPYEDTPNSEIEIPQENNLDPHVALNNMNEYLISHNYGREDFDVYSKDPEWQALNRDLQIANGYDVSELETVEGEIPDPSELNEINEVGDWIEEINPNYDPFDWESPYSNNCGSCAYAVYRRLEGDTDIVATAENIGYNSQMEALTGMEQVSMNPEEIASRLLEQGDGAHAIIGIDRAEGPGHWFNAACIDGKVVAIDGQSGEINDWPPDYGDVVNWEMSIKKDDDVTLDN